MVRVNSKVSGLSTRSIARCVKKIFQYSTQSLQSPNSVPKTYLTSCSCFLLKFFHDKAAQEAREASRSGDGNVVVPPAGGGGDGMPGVDKEKAAFDGNLL